jgi:4-hydroxymandelate oxidase
MSISPSLTWEDVRRLRAGTRLPFVIKGILTPDDALRAREAGADAIVVSNHGGRNLDSLPVAIQALPVVAATVGGSMRVLVDGGIRRGTDVLKALALGADVVMIGRPYVCALCVGGASGVRRVQELLAAELEAAMALIGRVAIRDLDDTAIWSRAAR